GTCYCPGFIRNLLGNISILADLENAEMWTDYGRFQSLQKSGSIETVAGEQISFFDFDPTMTVTISGVKWPLKRSCLPRWWTATLNETTGTEVRIEFDGSSPMLIYRPWVENAGKQRLAERPNLPWRHVHFCGIGGVGVSALAHMMLDAGLSVSGSDAVTSAYTAKLSERGATIAIGERAENVPSETDLLVYSAAVTEDNPERQFALSHGIPQCKRGEFLARIAHCFKKVIAVSGSHGKTSTTAIIAHVLKECGRNPAFMIGGNVKGFQANGAWGDGEILVTEADESDRSQELLLPSHAIVLNIDDDHSWAIGGTEGLEDCFRRLARQSLRVFTWDNECNRRVFDAMSNVVFMTDTEVIQPGEITEICGEHSRRNASIARKLLLTLGLTEAEINNAFKTFQGVRRRLELLAERDGKYLYEDYAHHPTELNACFQALREKHPQGEIHAFFQPHRPERLLRYGDSFAETLAANCTSSVIFAPFAAWEHNAPEANAQALVDKINSTTKCMARCANRPPESFVDELLGEWKTAQTGAVFVVIGAGDIGHLAQLTEKELKR
ncbi:MAG: Mur ligase domain-containing protein, partial [Lentisphaeria bacterium]|nr:Mur ligase domain-containing protein [Lentisphaeria bacterium]